MITALVYLLCAHVAVQAKTYDYIVVGSGSAGSVVANRLSEDPAVRVLLLEAGGKPHLVADVPLFSEIERTERSWNYRTVPLKNAGFGLVDRVSPVPRGKVLGGTSTINANMYTRGNSKDYDNWAAQGAVGWDWEGVYPYFLKHEDNGDPILALSGYHNVGGDQPINYPPFRTSLVEAYLKAAELLGYHTGDYNGRNQTVFNFVQGTIKEGRRWSGVRAFLDRVVGRRNLDVVTLAFVTKILIDQDKKAYGVSYDRKNRTYEALAREEVILCAGVFNSPQLLMLSGIGPREELRKLGIPVVSDLPVGHNLQDHLMTNAMVFTAETYTPRNDKLTKEDYDAFLNNGTGPLSMLAGTEVVGFVKSKYADSDLPDIEILWSSVATVQSESSFRSTFNANTALWKAFQPYVRNNVIHCYPYVLVPKSIGKMWISSANPYDPPVIDPNYYSDPYDIKVMVEAMKFCLEMAAQEPMRRKGVRPVPIEIPGCHFHIRYSDEHLACVAKVAIESINHFVGTCKMGDPGDPTTVVDPLLRVKGVNSLRVVDTSIIPIILSGHTHAPAAMIGEKGAHLILRDLRKKRNSLKMPSLLTK